MQKLDRIISDLRTTHFTSKFINSRRMAERAAREMLLKTAGSFDKKQIKEFLYLCNTELIPHNDKETFTRFRNAFVGQNCNLMMACMRQFNIWVSRLWQANENNIIIILDEFWSKNTIKGVGIGLPTMILYLKKPEHYNIWLPFLSNALKPLAGKKLPLKRNGVNYQLYNETVNILLRNKFNLQPQEIDCALHYIQLEYSK